MATAHAVPYELLVPFKYPPDRLPVVTRIRSTLLTASFEMIRQLGHEARYLGHLSPSQRDAIAGLVAGSWLPLEVGEAHYRACDAMDLSQDEIRRMGEEVSIRTQRTFMGTLAKIANSAGATPLFFFENSHRLWARVFDGGDQATHRCGPKETLTRIVGCPLVRVPYFRQAICHYYRAIAGAFSRSAFAHEERRYGSADELAIRISWV